MPIAALRFNNPFDVSLPIAGWNGGGSVVGISGQSGFASFPDMGTGYSAGVQRLQSYITGQSSYGPLTTIGQLNSVYATDPNWANGVSKYSGIGINDPLNVNDPAQMSNLQYGVLAQEMGPSNATNIFNSYGNGGDTNTNTGSIWDTGTGSVPYAGSGDLLGTPSGDTIGGLPGYAGGNSNYQTDIFGNPVNYGSDFNSPTAFPDTTGTGNAINLGGTQYGTGLVGQSVPAGDLFNGILGGLTGQLSGNSSKSSGADFFAWLGDWAIRGAIISLGFVFVVAGLYMLKGNIAILKEAVA